MAVKKTRLGTEPCDGAFAVVPSDATQLVGVRGLWVGGAGTLVVEMLNPETGGATVTFTVPAGVLLPLSVERVLAASTATLIVALR